MTADPGEPRTGPLQAILLVTKTRAGPRILLCYPPSPANVNPSVFDPHQAAPNASNNLLSISPLSRANALPSRAASHGTAADRNIARTRSNSPGRIGTADNRLTIPDDNLSVRRPSTAFEPTSPSAAITPEIAPPRPATASAAALPPSHRHALHTHFSPPSVQQTWTSVLGFPAEGLARMLAPNSRRAWHRRRHEVQMGSVEFVGCPVYEREKGGWRGKSKAARGHKDASRAKRTDEAAEDEEENAGTTGDTMTASSSPVETTPASAATTNPRAALSQRHPEDAPAASFTTASSSLPSSNSGGDGIDGLLTGAPDTLNMFNVVFVLAPSSTFQLPHSVGTSPEAPNSTDRHQHATGHQQRTREVFVHCVKKLARALQLRQKKVDYIWEEVRKIIRVREKAREADASYAATWPTLYNASSLVRALATTFAGLNTSNIAHLSLGSGITLTLQLPQTIATPQVPTPTAPNLPSASTLLLTTFKSHGSDDPSHIRDSHSTSISSSSALLLLVPAETLLKEISQSESSALTAPLSYYIRQSLPTKTLAQLARKSRLSLTNIQLLSQHLVYWRRARAIPPLHYTNTYIVSPLADWSRLRDAMESFGARFPALPDLPSMLARISAGAGTVGGKGPQHWGRMMPTPDHKDAYMEILAWLVRGGWVTQLRTFAWVVIPAKVKAEVAQKVRKEERGAAAAAARAAGEEAVEADAEESGAGTNGHGMGNGLGSSDAAKHRKSSHGSSSLLSPRLRPHLQVPRRTSEAGSISSVSTALRIPLGHRSGLRVESPAPRSKSGEHAHRLSDGSMRSRAAVVDDAVPDLDIDTSIFEPSIVVSPHKANAIESRWLEHVGTLQDADVRDLWPRLLSHFDGKHALEEIAMREGLKRKVVAPVLAKLAGEGGVLRTVKHW